ncbi:MAG: CarD family transcriptional regulator [Rickettsiales bacterium]|jgi:CarD family transcriptional regulator|nr:CarD family transcriptional regulator [Rickettsiales bacterium]
MMTNFKINDYCVYRTHGVAKITDIQNIKIGKDDTKCLVLYFEKEKLTLLAPLQSDGGDIRKISTAADMDKVVTILRGGAKKTKSMWSKRAKEYRDRISSGDIFQTAEVLRDLIRGVDEADRSFSERNIYDLAIYRIASEYAIVKKISYEEAEKRVCEMAKDKAKSADG